MPGAGIGEARKTQGLSASPMPPSTGHRTSSWPAASVAPLHLVAVSSPRRPTSTRSPSHHRHDAPHLTLQAPPTSRAPPKPLFLDENRPPHPPTPCPPRRPRPTLERELFKADAKASGPDTPRRKRCWETASRLPRDLRSLAGYRHGSRAALQLAIRSRLASRPTSRTSSRWRRPTRSTCPLAGNRS